jgi:hypothetical protein
MNSLNRTFLRLFRLDIETGVGLTSGQGSDPQVALRVSRDAGHTWDPEVWRSFGERGQYSQLVDWRELGMARQWAVEVIITDPVPSRIAQALIALEEGTS